MTPPNVGTQHRGEQKEQKQYAPDHTPKHSAFQLTRLKQQTNRPWCHNPHGNVKGHTAKASQHLTRKKVASFKLMILGYPTYLCPQCAVAWQKTWNNALKNTFPD